MTPLEKKQLWAAIDNYDTVTRYDLGNRQEARGTLEDIVDRIATPIIPDTSVVKVSDHRESDGKPQFSIVVGGPEFNTPMAVPANPPKAFVLFLWNGAAYDMSLYLRNDESS